MFVCSVSTPPPRGKLLVGGNLSPSLWAPPPLCSHLHFVSLQPEMPEQLLCSLWESFLHLNTKCLILICARASQAPLPLHSLGFPRQAQASAFPSQGPRLSEAAGPRPPSRPVMTVTSAPATWTGAPWRRDLALSSGSHALEHPVCNTRCVRETGEAGKSPSGRNLESSGCVSVAKGTESSVPLGSNTSPRFRRYLSDLRQAWDPHKAAVCMT